MRFWIFYRKGAIQIINVIVIVIVIFPAIRKNKFRKISLQSKYSLA